uniref:Carboxylic ester hydrolase n=1 Tax=Ciona savignyi TaxID=51511 RepID=H2YJK5_CIOSA
VYKFSSIPFAKPPVGELRFERPQDAETWSGVLDGTRPIPSPFQDIKVVEMLSKYIVIEDIPSKDLHAISEDCLYLNVYTNNLNPSANMPVLVWFFGGGLAMGSAIGYSGQTICSMHDVVVVIPNYRVNVFGFFTAGKDTKWKGNMGFFDQHKALEWTKENIKSFGGNPDNVTIFGQSAGAASVGIHMLSPVSRGYFHRAITHSGTATMPGLCKSDQGEFRKLFLEALNITEKDSDEMVAKLKKKPAHKLMEAYTEASKKMPLGPFRASIDGEFVPEYPSQLIRHSTTSAPVPFMTGCNNTEEFGILSPMIAEFESGASEETVLGLLQWMLMDKPYTFMMDTYAKKYSVDDKLKWSKVGGELMADMLFVVPTILQAKDSGHPCYVYYMTQTPAHSHSKEHNLSDSLVMKADFCECDHGDDIIFTWGFPYSSAKMSAEVKFTKDEQKMTEQWMKYIVNFATTGNPNKGQKVPVEWPLYKSSDK